MDLAFAKIIDQIKDYFNLMPLSELMQDINVQEFHKFTGSTLAQDVFALVPLPPFNASIKDGYAVIAEDGDGLRKVFNKASQAGGDFLPQISEGFCVRISTGAPVPSECNAVVQVEDTELVERTQVICL